MEENTPMPSERAASLIQKWYRRKRQQELIEREIHLSFDSEISIEKTSEHRDDNVESDEDNSEESGGDGMGKKLAMGAVKLGIITAITKGGTLLLSAGGAPVDQDDVVAAAVIIKSSEAQ